MTKDRDVFQDWLSSGLEKEESRQEDDIDRQYPGEDHPYNRFCREKLDLGLIHECLWHMQLTKEPLPDELIRIILVDIELLDSRREGIYFRAEKKTPTLHPSLRVLQGMVVDYVESAKLNKLDPKPMKTIKDKLGVSKSTYSEWKKRYPGPHEDSFDKEVKNEPSRSDVSQEKVDEYVEMIKDLFPEDQWDQYEALVRKTFSPDKQLNEVGITGPKQQMEFHIRFIAAELKAFKYNNK